VAEMSEVGVIKPGKAGGVESGAHLSVSMTEPPGARLARGAHRADRAEYFRDR